MEFGKSTTAPRATTPPSSSFSSSFKVPRWKKSLVFALLLLGAVVFYLSPFSTKLPFLPARIDNTRPIELVRQACQLRFWKHKALPYCERASATSWIAGTAENDTELLEVFQVHTPPRAQGRLLGGTPDDQAELQLALEDGVKECSQVLMQHTFGWSYGKPFVGQYNPPTTCNWTNVVFELSMTSKGRQFDRLGHLFLGDIEVWRTSTAEPNPRGIIFNYTKDMTHLSTLLRQPQKLIFDLGNLVNDVYTGSFNATLTAIYYSPYIFTAVRPANQILPITAQKSTQNQPSHFHLPSERAIATPRFPANTIRAVVSISASGNQDEEFWYTNVPTEYTHTFPTPLLGHGPFREIQVLVDGNPVGFVWPFATIFTGGIVPSLWRPIVAPTAFDLPEYEIDITPFLPLLLNGTTHTIELAVFTYDSTTGSVSRSLGTDWLVTGRIHVWTDANANWKTTGTLPQVQIPPPSFTFTPTFESDGAGGNSSFSISLTASRNIHATSSIITSTGIITTTWLQGLSYNSQLHYRDGGNTVALTTWTTGSESTVRYGSQSYHYSPFVLNTAFIPRLNTFEIKADIQLGYNTRFHGKWTDGIALGDSGLMTTRLKGTADWVSNVGGNGTTQQTWAEVKQLRDSQSVGSYGRRVVAVGGKVVKDWKTANNAVGGKDDPEVAGEVGKLLEF
ncbi:peptide N-acetyl-beta-D-glucosaminyl asparaginase amidase A-domain-containing protein [Trichophaea hybrida]|nr:peptide N-acetyl-beta-D-glucosaminyl asparaginase amidase A-domain-containing protein [Trichophaea hybrida]